MTFFTYIQQKLNSQCEVQTQYSMASFCFSSAGALYLSLKKRPYEMTRNSNCRAREFQGNRMRALPESPGYFESIKMTSQALSKDMSR